MIRIATALALLLAACAPSMAPPPHSVAGVAVEYRAAPYGAHGAAYYDGTTPVVGLRVADLHPAHQWFVLAHEWCHLEGAETETGADCCAARYLRSLGVPVVGVVAALQEYDAGPLHPPGAVRAAVVIDCYEGEEE